MYRYGTNHKRGLDQSYETYKEVSNQRSPYPARSTFEHFLSKRNVGFISSQVFDRAYANNFDMPREAQTYQVFLEQVKLAMADWAKKVNINQWTAAYEYDCESLLDFINENFLSQNTWLYQKGDFQNDINVFRGHGRFMSYDNDGNPFVEEKRLADLMPEDIRNMDVWRPVHIGRNNSTFRYNNQIPPWQRTMNIRYYDYNTDGYAMRDPNRASLDTFTRGYNMSDILKGNFYGSR